MQLRFGAALALVTAAWMVVPMTPAQADPERANGACTIVGTPGPDVLRGTRRDDVICGLGGDDKIFGRGGDDVLKGGGGDDLLVGGPGNDVLGGGRGDDTLNGLDNATAKDRLRCGRGEDTAKADPPDIVRPRCEHVEQDDAPTDLSVTPSSVAENQPGGTVVGTLTAVDPDPGDTHTFTLVAGAGSAGNGSFTIVGATLRTAVSLDFETTPTQSVRIRATDSGGLSVEKALTITVTDVDDPPVAVDDTTTVVEDAAPTAIDVLANDTDTDGGPKNVASVTQPTHGTVVITGGGTGLTYAPAPNYCNTPPSTDDFTYTLNGGDVGAVKVTVTCVDDAADAVDDTATVAEDSGATTINVLANDSDPESDPFSVTAVTQPANGAVTFTPSDVSYTPAADYCNTPPPSDTFDYTVTGGDTATVSVTVTCVNDAPVANDDTKTATEDTPLSFPASDLTGNDTDVDGDSLNVTAVFGAVGGTVGLVSGTVTFTPAADVCGPGAGSFDYAVSDGTTTDTGHVTVDVTCVNDDPVANDDSQTVAEDAAATVIDVLANDTDAELDTITVTGVAQPANGTVTFTANDVSYAPDPNYCNTPTPPFDTFDYTVSGGDSATVSVTVTCANDAPVVDLDTGAAGTGSTSTFNETDPHSGPGVRIAPDADVTDVDDANIESLTVVLTNRPDGDALESLSATIPGGSVITGGTYAPATGTLSFTGSSSTADYAALIASIRYDNTKAVPDAANRLITVVVNDGDLDSATSTATVQVVPINVPPVNTVPGAQTTAEDSALTFGAGAAISVTDPDNASLSVEVQVTHGTFTLSGTAGLTVTGDGTNDVTLSGTLTSLNAALNGATYAPDADFNGPAVLTVTSTDSLSASDTDTVAITVTPVNDPPAATNLSAAESYTEDTPLNLVDIVVSDVDGVTVTATLTLSTPAAGSLSVGTSGTVTSTYTSGTGLWSASGAIGDVNTLLAGVVFAPASNFNGNFTIATSVSDGIAAPVTGSKAMTGIAVNDVPVNGVPGAQVVDEDTDLIFTSGNLLTVSDVDSGPLTIQVSVTNGSFTLSGTAGLSGVTGDGTANVSATGSIANLNAALDGSKYRGTLNYNGPAQLTLDTSDGSLSDNDVVAITVNPVNDAPVADDETFNGADSAIGNTTLVVDDPTDGPPSATGPKKTITGDVLAGDTDVDGDTLAVVPATVTSGGGSVVIEADGDFTLLPPAGCAASYSFDYTVTDGGSPALTDTGTVTVAVTECVWYVDPGAAVGGDGRSNAPFQALTPVNGAGGAGDVDDDSDYLFVQAGSYGTGLVLESNQRLFGQPHGLTVAGTTLVTSGGGSNPTISNGSGHGLVLAAGNNVQGINLGSTPAGNAALTGTSVGTATMNTVTSGSINNATGGAVDISNGTLAMAFTSVASNGATNDGIRLDNTAGTFTASGGSLQNAGSQDVDISGNNSGDTVDFTYNGTITDDVGQLVSIANQNNGTKDFNGLITDGNDGDGSGISLSANPVATVRFDGGLVLSTGANPAFSATGGGTVVVNEPNGVHNSLTTTTGTSLNVTNTAIGADGLHFTSISSNGATNGIVLNNTGATAGLTVTGNGGTCSSVATCTGGSIQGSTQSGVLLNSTMGTSLTRNLIQTSGEDGIEGTNVTGLNLTGSLITNNGDDSEDVGVGVDNLFGDSSFSAVSVTGSELANVMITNTSGTLNSFSVTGASHFDNLGTAFGGNSILVEMTGTATMNTGLVDGATFVDNKPARGITVQAQGSSSIGNASTNAFVVQNSRFTNNGLHASFEQSGTANLTFKLLNNGTAAVPMTMPNTAIGTSHAVNVFSSSTSTGGTVRGRISGNRVGDSAVAGSGSATGNGIRTLIQGKTQATLL